MFKDISIKEYDPALSAAMEAESVRQENHIELIASENYCSQAVMEAQGSDLTNKYAEGYPGKRYYGGCEHVDVVEQLAIDRAKELFGAEYVNVQPHSGSQANAAVFLALLDANDTILGMSLDAGGHLTHGAHINFSGINYKAVQYGLVEETGLIDYDQVDSLAREHKPKMIIAGFSAYSQVVDWQRFRDIADEIGAYFLVDMAHIAGMAATNTYPSPVPFADVVTSTTHKTLRGPRSGVIMSRDDKLAKKINSAVFPGNQGGPLMHVIAAKAICFKEALEDNFKTYQEQVIKNAKAMAKVIQERGYEIISGGTENHLMLISLVKQEMTGKEADKWLGDAHITVNKNAVPNDPKSPFVTSGIRIGTGAVTTRGFDEADVIELAGWMCDVLDARGDEKVLAEVREKVEAICAKKPVYAKNQ